MLEFFRKLFAPESSGATARERLRLVLLSDHLSLAPDVVESLRADLIAVISKYVEVDEANCDVSFEQQDRAVAVLANIPIVSMRSRPPASAPPSGNGHAPPDQSPVAGSTSAAVIHPEASAQTQNVAADAAATAPTPAKRRRRRRRSGAKTAAAAG